MKLTYIHHSCFTLEGEHFTMIIDYYKDTTDRLVHRLLSGDHRKCYVLSSHSHADHFNPEILTWKQKYPDVQYIFSKDITAPKESGAIFLDKTESYQDTILNIQAFGSTDLGISFRIEAENRKIFHAGDLNNWHWDDESTKEEALEYENNFLNELEVLAQTTDKLDLVMFPIDPRLGKDYMRGAQQFVDRIKTSLFVPMHFWGNFAKAAAFKNYAESKGCKFIGWTHEGEEVEF